MFCADVLSDMVSMMRCFGVPSAQGQAKNTAEAGTQEQDNHRGQAGGAADEGIVRGAAAIAEQGGLQGGSH